MADIAVVIGGTGFIGRVLVRRLLERGAQVRVASRTAEGSAQDGLSFHRAPVGDAAAIGKLMEGAGEVYYLATGGGAEWSDFERDFLNAARNVGQACGKAGVRRLVYASSIAALYLGGHGTVDDATPTDARSAERAFYSRAKAEAEKILLGLHREAGLPVVIVRPAVVMGRGGMLNHSGLGYWAADTWCLGWGRGNNPLPFVLVEDVAAAMLAAARAPEVEGRVFNLAGDVRLSAAEFVAEMRRRARRDIHFYSQSLLKMQALEIGKWLMKVAARKPGNTFPSYRDLKSRGCFAHLDCSGAKRLLGWQPNADREHFLREAIDACLTPAPEGDLRRDSRG